MNEGYVKVNGKQMGMWTVHTKVDGVWYESDMNGKVEDVWNDSYKYQLSESHIKGFRLIYRLDQNASYPPLPKLKTNTNIPVRMNVAGKSTEMDYTEKGVVYTYTNDWWSGNYEEGIVSYNGTLYAILDHNVAIVISFGKKFDEFDEYIKSDIPGISEIYDSNRISTLSLGIKGFTHVEGERRLVGWNGLFSSDQNLGLGNTVYMNPLIMLPMDRRSPTYCQTATIGIVRSLTTVEDNMLGSWGHMTHTINNITVNNIPKPFTVEIIN